MFVAHGVEKIRLTGGEVLLRKNIEYLIERLALLRTTESRALDLTLTTNGSLLARKAQSLKNAGLTRVTVSLDALDDALFRRMNDADFARELMNSLGDVAFWKIAMRPGRPLAFGRLWTGPRAGTGESVLFFGLPGNPVTG